MPRRSPRFIDLQVLAELAQIAPDVKRRILKYATRRARMIADAGYPVAGDEPSILVADAIADTLTGVVIWDRRYRLSYHLCSVVRTRTSNQIKRAKRMTRVSLEAASDREGLVAPVSIDGGRAPARPDALLENARVAHELYGMVRDLTIRDASAVDGFTCTAVWVQCGSAHPARTATKRSSRSNRTSRITM